LVSDSDFSSIESLKRKKINALHAYTHAPLNPALNSIHAKSTSTNGFSPSPFFATFLDFADDVLEPFLTGVVKLSIFTPLQPPPLGYLMACGMWLSKLAVEKTTIVVRG